MATDLKAPCQHGRYDQHAIKDGQYFTIAPDEWGKVFLGPGDYEVCLGGSLLPPDSLVIVKEDGEWPGWAIDRVYYEANDLAGQELRILDALWEGSK